METKLNAAHTPGQWQHDLMIQGRDNRIRELSAENTALRAQVVTRDRDLRKMDAYNAELRAENAMLREALKNLLAACDAPVLGVTQCPTWRAVCTAHAALAGAQS